MRLIAFALLCTALPCSPASAAAQDVSPYRALQSLDAELAATGYRLATANAPLCDRLDAGTGMLLHDISQYNDRAAIDGVFAFESPVEVAAVVPGSPAAMAGIMAGDALVAIAGTERTDIAALTDGLDEDAYARIQHIADLLAAARNAGQPITLELLRTDAPYTVRFTAAPACATRYQLITEDGYEAGADGRMVSINLPLFQYAAAEGAGELAAVVAHELAHNILRHRERLDAVDIDRGLARLFGKNARRIKATEEEADRLSVWLMANAGYDPHDAVRFWTRFGKEHGQGIFTEGTHYRWQNRAAQIEEEIAAFDAAVTREGVRVPPILTGPLPSLE